MTLKRFVNLVFLHLAQMPMPGKHRAKVLKWGGVNVPDTQGIFIGANVTFDTNHPELITIEPGVYITVNSLILSHFKNVGKPGFYLGKVHIKRNAFIGAGSVVCKPVTIGENAIIGANSVITKDIPDNEIWAGAPARFIKRNEI